MRIGILAESDYDTLILQELTKKVASQATPPIRSVEFLPAHEAHGTVIPDMELASSLFFGGAKKVDCTLFGIDLDQNPRRRRIVNDFVKVKAEGGLLIVPLFSDPHVEEILFADGGNAIKSVLIGLSPEAALPYGDLPPKKRLQKLIRDFGPRELSLTDKDVYRSIAAAVDLDQLSRGSANFKRFRERFLRGISFGTIDA